MRKCFRNFYKTYLCVVARAHLRTQPEDIVKRSNLMIREYQKLEQLQKKIMEMFPSVEPDDVDQEQPTKRKKPLLSDDQIWPLSLASHFRLRRSHSRFRYRFAHRRRGIRCEYRSGWRSCWYAQIPFDFFDRRPSAIRTITIRKLWEKNYLDGIPDGVLVGSDDRNTEGVYLVASEAGKAILEKIKAQTGIYYDIDTYELVRPKRRSRQASARRAEHEDYCLKSRLRG